MGKVLFLDKTPSPPPPPPPFLFSSFSIFLSPSLPFLPFCPAFHFLPPERKKNFLFFLSFPPPSNVYLLCIGFIVLSAGIIVKPIPHEVRRIPHYCPGCIFRSKGELLVASLFECTFAHIHIHKHTHTHMCICVCMCLYIYKYNLRKLVFKCVYVCIYVYIHNKDLPRKREPI